MGRRAHVCARVRRLPLSPAKTLSNITGVKKMFDPLPARLLQYYRKHIVLLTAIMMALLPACMLISSFTGWEYVLYSKLRLVVLLLVLSALTLATHASTTNAHPYCALCLLPLSCIAACLIHVGPASHLTCILTLALVFLSAIIAMRTKAARPVRFTAQLLCVPLILFLILSSFLRLSGFEAVVEEGLFPSPDGEQIAQLRCTDEGALGGRTQVRLISAHERIPLLLGEFHHARTLVDCGWMPYDDIQISWIDAHTLAMNETRIPID